MSTPPQSPDKKKPPVNKGDVVDVTIDSLVYGGRGLARIDGYVIFVPHVMPGDVARVKIFKRKSGHAEADLVEIVQPAPGRVTPPCPLFTTCGGCTWQHVPIDVQLHWKQQMVVDALRLVPGLDVASVTVDPIVASPRPMHYRNKMEFTFGQEEGAPLALGFHKPGNWKHILDVESCWLQPEPLNRLLAAARAEGIRQGLTAWSPMRHEGDLRQLLIRWSEAEGRALVAILTGTRDRLDFGSFRRALTTACPEIKGVVWGLNAGRSDVARAEEVITTWGPETIEERLGDLRFRISLGSFFQTNTLGAQELYSVAREYLGLTGREKLLDAYCGTGTIGLFCAAGAAHVYGIEIIRDAIWDARENAKRNGIRNCTFMAGDMAETLPKMMGAIEGPLDRLVVDPPRSGMDKKALERLVALRAPVLVYVSCNPTTMARDMQTMVENGYRLTNIRPVDMFPQTYHIECVARFELVPG